MANQISHRLANIFFYMIFIPMYLYFTYDTLFNVDWNTFFTKERRDLPLGFDLFLRLYFITVLVTFLVWAFKYKLDVHKIIQIATTLWVVGLILIILSISIMF